MTNEAEELQVGQVQDILRLVEISEIDKDELTVVGNVALVGHERIIDVHALPLITINLLRALTDWIDKPVKHPIFSFILLLIEEASHHSTLK